MMLSCPDCGGRFFKTLDVRFHAIKSVVHALLYKKRCKRCKNTVFIELTNRQGVIACGQAHPADWDKAYRLHQYNQLFLTTGQKALVSQYTQRISADTARVYRHVLNPLEQ